MPFLPQNSPVLIHNQFPIYIIRKKLFLHLTAVIQLSELLQLSEMPGNCQKCQATICHLSKMSSNHLSLVRSVKQPQDNHQICQINVRSVNQPQDNHHTCQINVIQLSKLPCNHHRNNTTAIQLSKILIKIRKNPKKLRKNFEKMHKKPPNSPRGIAYINPPQKGQTGQDTGFLSTHFHSTLPPISPC